MSCSSSVNSFWWNSTTLAWIVVLFTIVILNFSLLVMQCYFHKVQLILINMCACCSEFALFFTNDFFFKVDYLRISRLRSLCSTRLIYYEPYCVNNSQTIVVVYGVTIWVLIQLYPICHVWPTNQFGNMTRLAITLDRIPSPSLVQAATSFLVGVT